ncbi:MAG TPA: glycosyltransferase, partial [Thermoanaerobaculia bacterium]
AGLVAYTYAGYPALLLLLGRRARPAATNEDDASWPSISILVAAYNEEHEIRATVERLLALDYPVERRQILIVSDASSDRTDEIVREYADRGVELLRVAQRGGKTAAENAASGHLRGEIIVNTDASIRIRPDALKPMIAAFRDPAVGVVSGCDVSVSAIADDANKGEAAYVGYEMWVRELETNVGGIVGASGCFFAIRAELQRIPAPTHLSRDFAAALVAREHGMRALSAPASICYVPRSNDLRAEYRRKVRTFTRGMETLLFKRHLLNPLEQPVFAWKLFSHKVTRWLIPWAAVAAYLALAALAIRYPIALLLLVAGTIPLIIGIVGWKTANPARPQPRWVSIPAYAVAGSTAVLRATLQALRGERAPIWEPTRRNLTTGGVAGATAAAPAEQAAVGVER